jgi:ATP-binding cassette subfamily F protein uup
MSAPLLSLSGVTVGFGGRPLFHDVDLVLAPGDRVCLVGRNGSGKSTLLKVAAGLLQPDGGVRSVRLGARVAYVPQEPVIEGFATLGDFVADGLDPEHAHERYRADAALDAIGLDPARSAEGLSGGEIRRAVLARMTVGRPDVLLLDEPTNHLDLPTIEWLERQLGAFRGALVVISHDRAFLEHLTTSTLWLDRGVLRRNPNAGFAGFDDWAEAALAEEAKQQSKLDKLIAQETQWLREGISARRTRDQGRLRRLNAMRAERAAQVARAGNIKLNAERGDMSGKLVIEATGLRKAYGDRVVLRDFGTTVLRGDRVGIIGPNGAGKSTLIKLLMGEIEPDKGTVRLGTNLTPVYLDQHRATLDPDATVWETLAEKGTDQVLVHGRPRHVMSYLEDFLFSSDRARSPVRSLSGGERNRLLLARALARPSNLLVLDEPTNDLDIETLDVLEDVLADYAGTLLLVSHDRDFLDRVVTSTIALEGDGEAIEYAGGYSDYLRQRVARRAEAPVEVVKPAAERPKRAQKKLSFKQQRELEALPGQMAALQDEIAGLEALMGDPDAYGRDPEGFQAGVQRLEAARGELAALEERWLELEMLREELAEG